MRTYTEQEVAAEEAKIGGRLPDQLRRRYLEGMPDEVVLKRADGSGGGFEAWGPSTTTTDTKGRPYPTPGMAKETDEVREAGEDLLSDAVLVAWGSDGSGDLAVVLRDGSLGWWHLSSGDVEPVEVDWEPTQETYDRIEAGEQL